VTRKLCILVALVYLFLPSAVFSKKKEKVLLSQVVLKAQTVFVIIDPDAGEPMNDLTANRKAREDVEKALMTWGRFRLVQEISSADIVITVKKGTDKAATPTINGGPADSRPGTVETTDNQIRIGGKHGKPADGSYDPDSSPSNDKAQQRVEVGPSEDSFRVFLGGDTFRPSNASIWSYRAKNALRPPGVDAVQEFRKAIADAEQAAAKKQQKASPQQKTP
jgi:hypothetical protein